MKTYTVELLDEKGKSIPGFGPFGQRHPNYKHILLSVEAPSARAALKQARADFAMRMGCVSNMRIFK
jgi:1,2-phenylacetyl-CoA epoxidase PaaB subunit